MSVREESWVSPWFASHAKNVIRGAYDDGGHFHCYIVEVRFSMPSSLHMSKNDSDVLSKIPRELIANDDHQ